MATRPVSAVVETAVRYKWFLIGAVIVYVVLKRR